MRICVLFFCSFFYKSVKFCCRRLPNSANQFMDVLPLDILPQRDGLNYAPRPSLVIHGSDVRY